MNALIVLSLCAAASGDADVFSRFNAWAAEYRAAKTDLSRAELLPSGEALARARRAELLELMRKDPETALKKTTTRDGLPPTVAAELELPIRGIVRYEVLGVLDKTGGRTVIHRIVLGEKKLNVTPWGALSQLKTTDQVQVVGVMLGQDAAVEAKYAAGGTAQSAWTVGTKPMRYIRVDFSDSPGDPLSLAQAQMVTGQLNNYLRAASYNKTALNVTVIPMTLRMPRTKASYGSANDTDGLLRDARSAASQAGFTANSNTLDVVAFTSVPGWSWAGLGYVGQSGSWLNGSLGLGTLAHEVGHNYGLSHANFWQASNETVIGAGSSLEYGNPFEIMGDGDGHYNAWYKDDLDWFNAGEVAVLAAGGTSTHRLYDLETLIGSGTHALRIPIGATRDYWVEFRPSGGGTLARGASINWGYSSSQSSNLLDMTPWTSTAQDSALVVGRTFSDFTAGIHITPTAVENTTPTALGVTVNRGLFPTNRPPTVMLTCSAQGNLYDCSATAMDPDSDPLAYYWDFGDNVASTNSPTQSRTISGARDVLARVTVTDMKGGTATASVATRFGNPSTYRITGQVLENGNPVEGVRIYSGNRTTWTNSDGTYTLVGLPSGSYPVSARKTGYTFTALFTNPVNVNNQNVMNVNFTGSRATFTISGRVTSVGQGFAGATVSAGVYSTFTNSNGDYTLTGVPAGAYQLVATGPNGENFIPQGFNNPVQITNASVMNRNFVELVFPVSGRVTGLAGPHAITDGVRNANTALNAGAWTWTLPKVPPGTWNIIATAPGQAVTPSFVNPVTVTNTGVIRDGANMARTSLDFVATAGTVYSVSGFIDEAGGPSLGSVVDAGSATGRTDSRGIYVIPNLPAGTYTLTPAKPGYVFGPAAIDVTLPNPDGGNDWGNADFTVLNANVAPTFAFPPHATPSPVTGTTTSLTTLGFDPIEAEGTLKYTWTQVFGQPAMLSLNATNAAKQTTVTFTKPGAHSFDVTVEDLGGLFSTANVTLLVTQTTTSVDVTPSMVSVDIGAVRQFIAAAKDQFGETIDFGGEAVWSVSPDSCGTISATGRFTGVAAGMCTVTAEFDGKQGTAMVNVVVGAAPRITMGPTATPSPVTMGTTTALSVTADDNEGEAQLTYTWKMVNGPAGVAFAPNGTNAAKQSTATFTAAGRYDLQIEVKDSDDISTSAFLTVDVMAGGLARITVSGPAMVDQGKTATYTVAGFDLAGGSIATGACTWTTTAGTIDGNGVLTAQQDGTVTATCGAVTGSTNVDVLTTDEMPKKGCGCTSGEGLALIAAMALFGRLRRRRP